MTHELMVEFFLQDNNPQNAGKGKKFKSRRRRQGRKPSHSTRKMSKYARTQQLFRENPGLLAKHVRMGTDHLEPLSTQVPRDEVQKLYSELWGKKPERVNFELGDPDPKVDEKAILREFTPSEVIQRLRRIAKSSAPGKDGLKKANLTGAVKANIMSLFFTLCLLNNLIPTAWRENRTTLIPKEGKDPTKAGNSRPITMSSMVARLFWGIIDERIRGVIKMSPRQKGFVSESGCFNNVQIFSDVIKHMKATKGGVAVQIDIKKAFDTAPHEAILNALLRKGIPQYIANYIAQSYKDVSTSIAHPDGPIEITLLRGVKQGDPLSPLLFNLLIEPLLAKLESMAGYELDECSISCIAFADDLVLFARTRTKAQILLNVTADYLAGLGMAMAPEKSFAFEVISTRDTWYIVDPELVSGSERVNYCDPSTELTYLGISISPWYGINCAQVTRRFQDSLERLNKLALKPHQKLELLTKFVMTHFLHQLTVSIPSVSVLRKLDGLARTAVKNFLWLPEKISSGLLYTARADGGLGIPRYELLAVRVVLSAGRKYLLSEDPVIRALVNHSDTAKRLSSLAETMKIHWPCTKNDLKRLRIRNREEVIKEWSSQLVQGAAVNVFRGDKVANEFLSKPWLLKPTRFKTALQFRTDTAATRASLRRAKLVKVGEDQCRRCGESQETLAHVLNKCVNMKNRMIKRHDEIVEILARESMKKNETTTVEAMLGLTGVNLKPDLVVLNQKGLFVVDITVCYEREDYVRQAGRVKIDRYRDLMNALLVKTGAIHGEVVPIVIGSRGAMPKETIAGLDKLNIRGKGLLRTLSLTALRGSLELYYHFMDG
jgi:Reverse transcriptase (RNA-dependent DNA polymerase)